MRRNAYDAMLALPDDAPELRDVARELKRLKLDAGLRAAVVAEVEAEDRRARARGSRAA